MVRPSKAAANHCARDHRRTGGRRMATRSRPEMASRRRVIPAAPVTSNAVRANALPVCTEAIATSTSAGAGTLAGAVRDRLRREEVAAMAVRAIRGATQLEVDDRDHLLASVDELIREVLTQNG